MEQAPGDHEDPQQRKADAFQVFLGREKFVAHNAYDRKRDDEAGKIISARLGRRVAVEIERRRQQQAEEIEHGRLHGFRAEFHERGELVEGERDYREHENRVGRAPGADKQQHYRDAE